MVEEIDDIRLAKKEVIDLHGRHCKYEVLLKKKPV